MRLGVLGHGLALALEDLAGPINGQPLAGHHRAQTGPQGERPLPGVIAVVLVGRCWPILVGLGFDEVVYIILGSRSGYRC